MYSRLNVYEKKLKKARFVPIVKASLNLKVKLNEKLQNITEASKTKVEEDEAAAMAEL